MNRIALHQSAVHPLDPVQLVDIAQRAGLDSVGLRVAAVDEGRRWWAKGIGSPMLRELVAALLATRVTVLDVGRVQLGPELRVLDSQHAYTRVLELGTRLGAQFVTARATAESSDDPAELFGALAELAGRYHVRPLLAVAPGTPVATLGRALEVVGDTGGGVVLDVFPGRHGREEVDETVVELGERLGYVRLPARELELSPVPGLLATLPPQVPVAISGSAGAGSDAPRGIEADHATRVVALREAVDAMLRHPRATAR